MGSSRGEKEGKAESLLFDSRLKMKENGSWIVEAKIWREKKKKITNYCAYGDFK